jgi:hypothetical protein
VTSERASSLSRSVEEERATFELHTSSTLEQSATSPMREPQQPDQLELLVQVILVESPVSRPCIEAQPLFTRSDGTAASPVEHGRPDVSASLGAGHEHTVGVQRRSRVVSWLPAPATRKVSRS